MFEYCGLMEWLINITCVRTYSEIAVWQVKDSVFEEELPAASESDKRLWAEELEGLSLQSASEILQLKQSLNSLGGLAEPTETDRSRDTGPRGGN